MMSSSSRRRVRLLLSLRRGGISDTSVLTAMERTPRDLFVPSALSDLSWEDRALPIECGQTLSQPLIAALMAQHADLDSRSRVLEVGSGSGYLTAILSGLCARVYAIERHRSLRESSRDRWRELGISNVTSRVGDGYDGWIEQAPFDRIVSSARCSEIPRSWLSQLKPGGILVMPLGDSLIRSVSDGEGGELDRRIICAASFVPLVRGRAD